jgi:protein TonB
MSTWAVFLTDDVAERRLRVRSVAMALSVLLHAGAVAAAFTELPWTPPVANEWGVDVTVEFARQVDHDPSRPLEAEVVTPEPAPATHLLLSDPVPVDPPSSGDFREAALMPEIVPSDARPERQEVSAVLTPLPPDSPSLDKMLPTVDAPPEVDAHDFARIKPAPAKPPEPRRAQATAVQPPSPARRPAQDPKPAAALKSDAAQQNSEEDYFFQLVRKISQYRFYSRSQDNVPRGLVVARMTIARDGRLLDVALLKSSGFPTLDNAVVETIRQASPFAPLPGDLAQGQKTFIVPVNYTREH